MLFEVEQGEDLASLRDALDLEGPQGEIAREIMSECPTLTKYEESFWRSFGDIATMRPVGMSAQPIPLDRIVWYAQHHGFSRTDEAILTRVIRNMDSAFLNAIKSKASASS